MILTFLKCLHILVKDGIPLHSYGFKVEPDLSLSGFSNACYSNTDPIARCLLPVGCMEMPSQICTCANRNSFIIQPSIANSGIPSCTSLSSGVLSNIFKYLHIQYQHTHIHTLVHMYITTAACQRLCTSSAPAPSPAPV